MIKTILFGCAGAAFFGFATALASYWGLVVLTYALAHPSQFTNTVGIIGAVVGLIVGLVEGAKHD